MTDSRPRPQIPTYRATNTVLAMFLGRLGSLNSVEQLNASPALRAFVGGDLPSADSLGRIMNLCFPSTIRKVLHHLYSTLKANKALAAPSHGMIALALDGHESHCSYKMHCSGCLARRKVVNGEEIIQYYHRNVTAQLVFQDFRFLLDSEPQLPGEGEISCALRLLDRVLQEYPRAFHVVVMDGLYARSNVFNKIIEHGKEALAVLKDHRRDLLIVSDADFRKRAPDAVFKINQTEYQCWERTDEESWNQVDKGVRVVRSVESAPAKASGPTTAPVAPQTSSWTWVTTLMPEAASIQTIAQVGHSRWSIENEGFNELGNHWHADHVYKHGAVAIQNFWLMAMVACNLFRAFYLRNLKLVARAGKTMLHFARMITAELYVNSTSDRPP